MRKGEPVDPDSDEDTWELKRGLLMSMFFFDSDGTTNTDCAHRVGQWSISFNRSWWELVVGWSSGIPSQNVFTRIFIHWISNRLSHIWPIASLLTGNSIRLTTNIYARSLSRFTALMNVNCQLSALQWQAMNQDSVCIMDIDILCTNNTTRVQGRSWTLEFADCMITHVS